MAGKKFEFTILKCSALLSIDQHSKIPIFKIFVNWGKFGSIYNLIKNNLTPIKNDQTPIENKVGNLLEIRLGTL